MLQTCLECLLVLLARAVTKASRVRDLARARRDEGRSKNIKHMHLISKARHFSTKSAHLYGFKLDQALPVNIPTYVHTFCTAQWFCFNLEETKTELKGKLSKGCTFLVTASSMHVVFTKVSTL
jgi:hypothetical protein